MLADNSGGGGASISLVLWGDDAENFSLQNKIIAIKKANLKEFNGVKNLNYPRGGSMEVSPSCHELPDLEFWVAGMRDAIDLVTPGSGTLSGSVPGGPAVTIQEIKDAMAEDRAEKKFTITGYPIKVCSRMYLESYLTVRLHFRLTRITCGTGRVWPRMGEPAGRRCRKMNRILACTTAGAGRERFQSPRLSLGLWST